MSNSSTFSFKRAVIFTFLFVFLSYLFSNFYSKVIMKDSVHFRKEREFIQKHNGYNILALGDSHVEEGIDPRVMNKVYNYASSGENYLQTYFKFKNILSFKKDIKEIILSVDYNVFATYRYKQFLFHHFWRKHINFYEAAVETGDYFKFLKLYFRSVVFTFTGEYLNFKYFFKPPKYQELYLGYAKHTGDLSKVGSDQVEKENNDRIRQHFEASKDIYDARLMKYFHKILELASSKNINITLVSFPNDFRYFQGALKYVDSEKFEKLIKSFLDKYPKTRYFNYKDLYVNDSSYFYNTDHLNEKGAQNFSKLLNERIHNE